MILKTQIRPSEPIKSETKSTLCATPTSRSITGRTISISVEKQSVEEKISHFSLPELKSTRLSIFLLAGAITIFLLYPAVFLATRDANNIDCIIALVISIALSILSWFIAFGLSSKRISIAKYFSPLCVLITVGFGIYLVEQQHFHHTEKYSNELQDHLAMESTIIMLILPMLLDSIFPSISWHVTLLCFTISSGFLMGNIIAYYAVDSILPVVIGMAMSGIALTARRSNLEQWMEEAARVTTDYISEAKHTVKETLTASNADEWRNLLSNIAHDMKTPLASFGHDCAIINSNLKQLDVLSTSCADEMPIRHEVSSIRNTVMNMRNVCDFMSSILNRCLDYAKASHGVRLVPFIEAVDLWDSLNRAVSCVRDLQPNSRVDLLPLQVEVSQLIRTDQQWLVENTLCLAANAVKHSPYGSPVEVRVLLQRSKGDIWQHGDNSTNSATRGDSLVVEVMDAGCGIPADLIDMLFKEEFCHMRRLSGGSGMGLYTLARRCEALGGSYGYRARSDGQQGTVFWFAIPYFPQEGVMRIIESTIRAPPISSSASVEIVDSNKTKHLSITPLASSLRILVVEDSLPILKLARKLLESDGHRVHTAANGYLGVQIWQNSTDEPFDAILMDLQMPVMNGFDAIRRIRMMERQHLNSDEKNQHLTSDEKVINAFAGLEVSVTAGGNVDSRRPSFCDSISTNRSAHSTNSGNGGGWKQPIPLPADPSRKQGVLIIACSADADEHTVTEAYAAGADHFLPKPLQLVRFKDLVFARHMSH